jgi:hypothetical protein
MFKNGNQMIFFNQYRFVKCLVLTAICLAALNCYSCAFAANTDDSDAEKFAIPLRGQYKALKDKLSDNVFKRPIVLNSTESNEHLEGEIYAVLDYPFAKVNDAMNNPEHWCDALILHINVKYCHALADNSATILTINLGKKYEQPLIETYKTKFSYQSITSTNNYFSIELKTKEGPLSTRDYRIWVEATPLDDKQTFLHFTYAYSFGVAGRLAMNGYLATIGRDKVGFTTETKQTNGNLNYIKGPRAVVERNTMRYYLAIDAYLAALSETPNNQFEKRLLTWFDNTELYAKQLHEVERTEYFSMKRKEGERQRVNK